MFLDLILIPALTLVASMMLGAAGAVGSSNADGESNSDQNRAALNRLLTGEMLTGAVIGLSFSSAFWAIAILFVPIENVLSAHQEAAWIWCGTSAVLSFMCTPIFLLIKISLELVSPPLRTVTTFVNGCALKVLSLLGKPVELIVRWCDRFNQSGSD